MKHVPPGAEESVCKSCGKRVFFVTVDRRPQILNPAAPTYQLTILDDGNDERAPRWEWRRANDEESTEPAFVSHFSTCSNPDAHSKK